MAVDSRKKELVGRKKEIQQIANIVKNSKSDFLAIYGRRRVGKTFLIREFFNYQFDFHISGLAHANTQQQLFNFHTTLSTQSSLYFEKEPGNWLIAFQRLIQHLELLEHKKKKVVFIDELPWFDTKSSDFMMGLEHFWNSWASARKDILLIVCGSAASWMLNNLINNTGGLHNRVTQKMKIEPFCLEEVKQMLENKNCVLDNYQIIQLYMAMGGIPYYLDMIQPQLSAAQNIQEMFFNKNGMLKNEFFNLYRSLFKKHKTYEKLVEILAKKTYGMPRGEIVKHAGIKSGGTLTKILADLEESGFIGAYRSLDGKNKNIIYRLSDYYTLFYLKFIKDKQYTGNHVWINLIDNPSHRAWQAFTFEQVCLDHAEQIKKALGIHGMLSDVSAWRGSIDKESVQIDLLIDRRDQVINVCEVKYSIDKVIIDKDYAEKLRKKINILKEVTQTKKSVFLTLISTYGLHANKYTSSLVQNEVTMDALFK
jgi:AAA+ ATPase superfamily predicted ATPase